jgi:anti-sigma regulatory factor (Ser/Thr protein kinase)
MQATIAKHGHKSDPPGILVTLVTAPDNIGMRISDQGTAYSTIVSTLTYLPSQGAVS